MKADILSCSRILHGLEYNSAGLCTMVHKACTVPKRKMKVGGVGVAVSVPRLEVAQGDLRIPLGCA